MRRVKAYRQPPFDGDDPAVSVSRQRIGQCPLGPWSPDPRRFAERAAECVDERQIHAAPRGGLSDVRRDPRRWRLPIALLEERYDVRERPELLPEHRGEDRVAEQLERDLAALARDVRTRKRLAPPFDAAVEASTKEDALGYASRRRSVPERGSEWEIDGEQLELGQGRHR